MPLCKENAGKKSLCGILVQVAKKRRPFFGRLAFALFLCLDRGAFRVQVFAFSPPRSRKSRYPPPLETIRLSPSSPASRELPPLGEAQRAADSRAMGGGGARAGRDALIAPPVSRCHPEEASPTKDLDGVSLIYRSVQGCRSLRRGRDPSPRLRTMLSRCRAADSPSHAPSAKKIPGKSPGFFIG